MTYMYKFRHDAPGTAGTVAAVPDFFDDSSVFHEVEKKTFILN